MRDLAVSALELRLQAQGPMRLPEYAGALLRGGFGKYLRELVCRTGAHRCEGCEFLKSCAYGVVFESAVVGEAPAAMLKAYPYAPHPCTIAHPFR